MSDEKKESGTPPEDTHTSFLESEMKRLDERAEMWKGRFEEAVKQAADWQTNATKATTVAEKAVEKVERLLWWRVVCIPLIGVVIGLSGGILFGMFGDKEQVNALIAEIDHCKKQLENTSSQMLDGAVALEQCRKGAYEADCPVCPPVLECPPTEKKVMLGQETRAAYDLCYPRVQELSGSITAAGDAFKEVLKQITDLGYRPGDSAWLNSVPALSLFEPLMKAKEKYEQTAEAGRGAALQCLHDVEAPLHESEEWKILNGLADWSIYTDVRDGILAAAPEWWTRDAVECSNFCSYTGHCRIRHVPTRETGEE